MHAFISRIPSARHGVFTPLISPFRMISSVNTPVCPHVIL